MCNSSLISAFHPTVNPFNGEYKAHPSKLELDDP